MPILAPYPYEKSQSLDAVSETDWILIPKRLNKRITNVNFELIPDSGGGTGTIFITNAPKYDVEAENANPGTIENVHAFEWPAGSVSEETQQLATNVSAYKLKCTIGKCWFNIRGT
jgi:hypothetical protein